MIKGKRAIAYFDILGFRKKVEELTIDELADSYSKLILDTENYVFDETFRQMVRKKSCKRFIFSDSIFLLACEDSEQGFVELFSYAWRMMQIALAMGYPLRGAITYGDVYADQSKGVFIGESIVSAASWESKQDWMGAVVDKTAVERYSAVFEGEDVLHEVYKVLMPTYPVPLKGGLVKNQRVINWRVNIVSQHGIKALFQHRVDDEDVNRKIQNTLTFAKKMRERGFTVFNDKIVPARYRRFSIQEHHPDQGLIIKNGDEY